MSLLQAPHSKILISSPAHPNAAPRPVGNTYSNVYLCQPNSESFLWNFDSTTSILTGKPGSTLWWDPSGKSYLQLVGDTVSFALANPNAGSVVIFSLRCDILLVHLCFYSRHSLLPATRGQLLLTCDSSARGCRDRNPGPGAGWLVRPSGR
ncbi:hypothetical protein K443DRAFT_110152 [Laccaria amethystina LaAM-08-1]|uniref:Uncharacterized protein n=1 Tax=Laccaria amethystina LaAM-08-1 TaxID=1095629 RepID=A0A0C9XA82_9AGAR|nr:hypothetical protein K443DRAFT_110152 [Laccaria amethystina LaAM-08-1]